MGRERKQSYKKHNFKVNFFTMPRIIVDNKIVISYDYTAKDKYWTALSKHLISKHGNQHFTDHHQVEKILLDGFEFLVQQFKQLISKEKRYTFFLYVFWLHEQSIQIHIKTLGDFELEGIDASEFAMYRRVLKLILEQGCDIDLIKGDSPDCDEVLRMDATIQELLYLATWMYGFADRIAFQKMVEECHDIYFDSQNLLVIDWQYHYGQTYKELFPKLTEDYTQGTFDYNALEELKGKIEECFNVKYNFAGGIIWRIQEHHNPQEPQLQTIEPDFLPLNLVNEFGISKELAETFYKGLTLSRDTKLPLEEVILKPYSTERYMFRPILVYNINGKDRALVGKEKFAESMVVLATNAIHWKAMYTEWRTLKCIQSFMNLKDHEHDRILEDKIEEVVKSKGFLYCRNLKSLKQLNKINVRIDNNVSGEIDFIIINQDLKTVFVSEVKYNRARYEAVGYRNDYSNFTDTYEKKLAKKVKWVGENLNTLVEHLRIVYNRNEIDLSGFSVTGIFIINTPTFYMFNGAYKAITLKQIGDFIEGKYEYPELFIFGKDGNEETLMRVTHPYFKKPIIITDDMFENSDE